MGLKGLIVNIFASKSDHLCNGIFERFFFILSKLFAVFDDFSKWRVPNVLQNSEKSPNIAKIVGSEDEENLAIFTFILMATFGTKNVHIE